MRTRGFTLIELFIVMAILSIIFVIVVAAVEPSNKANADTSVTQVSDKVQVKTYGEGVWLMYSVHGQGVASDGDYARALVTFRKEHPALEILSVTRADSTGAGSPISFLIITKEQ